MTHTDILKFLRTVEVDSTLSKDIKIVEEEKPLLFAQATNKLGNGDVQGFLKDISMMSREIKQPSYESSHKS